MTYKGMVKAGIEIASRQIMRRSGGRVFSAKDTLAREEPLEIRVRGKPIAVTMRTPGLDRELAAGFLLTEGVIKKGSDIIEIAECRGSNDPENVLNVFLAPSVEVDFSRLTRHVFASSSCGVCGKASIEAVHQQFEPIQKEVEIHATVLSKLPEKMRRAQKTFAVTGGLHAAGLFTVRGTLIFLAEDVGRHNAVDKVIGWALLNDEMPLDDALLMVSGRASFEIMQKSLAARIPIVAAVSAPSDLAAQFATESGQTLAGFLRGGSMNIYAGEQRVINRRGRES
jgi:FdhD protein